MKNLTLNFLLWLIFCATTQAQVVTEKFLNTVRRIESANGVMLIGDDGKSRGPYQMTSKAWNEVNRLRRLSKKPTFTWKDNSLKESISRQYARDYCLWLERRLRDYLKKAPTSKQVYAAYNIGLSGFVSLQCDLRRVNQITRQRCMQFN